jgi:hypothetical protein
MKKTKIVPARVFFLDEEVARLAKGQKTASTMPPADVLKWAASDLRAERLARSAALKAAGLPKGANVAFRVEVVGHAAKVADDVKFLERLLSLQDPR